ncbi:MAG: ABC transporter ATP-binding protein [Alphaproteobacteria bacterium]|nr:ABC transporter ATP-binding protein [Alphaproteobacteria bacterium]
MPPIAAAPSPPTRPAKVEIDGVSLRYAGSAPDDGSNLALDDVSFRVAEGEFVAIIGPSGCGKSSLLRLVSGLYPVTAGAIRVDGRVVDRVPPGIGFLFQSDALLPWKTALENVAIGATLAGRDPGTARDKARALLQELGLGAAVDKYPSELSGGMRKRVALSRTMAYEPTIFLLDEPFSALDAQTRIHVGNRFLRVLERLGQAVMFVTHDIDEAIALADRVVVMTAAPGRIAAQFAIDLPRPRDYFQSRMAPGFHDLQQQIWSVLRREMQGVLNDED